MMTLISETSMTFDVWILSRASLTLFINAIFVVVIVFISRIVEDMMLMREKRIRKEEKISWWKI